MGWLKCHGPALATLHSASQPQLWPPGWFPANCWMKENKYILISRWFCTLCRQHLKADSRSTITSLWDTPEAQGEGEILWTDRTSNNTSHLFCLEGKRSRGMSLFFVMGFGQWCGWMVKGLVKGLERTQLSDGERAAWGRNMWRDLSVCTQKEDVSFVNVPQPMTAAEMKFHS